MTGVLVTLFHPYSFWPPLSRTKLFYQLGTAHKMDSRQRADLVELVRERQRSMDE